jgi:Holliday junction DNA helicase RuvA
MICSLTGKLRRVDDDRVQLEAGPFSFELLVTAADLTELQASLGEELTLHTIFYLAGDPTRGGLEPTLIGFLRPQDKQFFEAFTTVKGIGPRKALKALTCSTSDIAGAIEGKDTRFLSSLDGIGKRMAEQIVAELCGKVAKFATATGLPAGKGGLPAPGRRPTHEEDAILALCAMGERRHDAENLLERAKQANPNTKTVQDLLREMMRMRAVRA